MKKHMLIEQARQHLDQMYPNDKKIELAYALWLDALELFEDEWFCDADINDLLHLNLKRIVLWAAELVYEEKKTQYILLRKDMLREIDIAKPNSVDGMEFCSTTLGRCSSLDDSTHSGVILDLAAKAVSYDLDKFYSSVTPYSAEAVEFYKDIRCSTIWDTSLKAAVIASLVSEKPIGLEDWKGFAPVDAFVDALEAFYCDHSFDRVKLSDFSDFHLSIN